MIEQRFLRDISYIASKTQPSKFHEIVPSIFTPHVPETLLEIWRRFGASSWLDGVFQTFDPQMFSSLIEKILSDFRVTKVGVATPFLLSAYGLVNVWHTHLGIIKIQFPLGRIVLSKHPSELLGEQHDDSTLIAYFPKKPNAFPAITGYTEDRARLGRLGENEVYGFFPALALGGGSSPDHVQRVQADVHLDFLAGLQPFRLLYFDGSGYRDVE